MARKLPSWIDGFRLMMKDRGSPSAFTTWAAVFAVAAVLERKVFVRTKKGVLYPNLYVINIGPPGIGKTVATEMIRKLMLPLYTGESNGLHIAPSNVSRASLIDALDQAKRIVTQPSKSPSQIEFNSLTVISNELGNFLPAYENDFMNTLTDLYDCHHYSEAKRSSKLNIKIDNPQLSFIAATTPSYMTSLLPEGAWDQGFLSRTILVYSGAMPPEDIFGDDTWDASADSLFKQLVEDLKDIMNMSGMMYFTEDAADALNTWHKAGGPPTPDHPKLMHYNTRRTAHMLKLCAIVSASQSSEMIITLDHFTEALDLLAIAEGTMPDIFKSMSGGGHMRAMEDCWHFAYQIYVKKQEAVPEHRMIQFLSERLPAHEVERVLNVMCMAQLLKRQIGNNGSPTYIPLAKKAA